MGPRDTRPATRDPRHAFRVSKRRFPLSLSSSAHRDCHFISLCTLPVFSLQARATQVVDEKGSPLVGRKGVMYRCRIKESEIARLLPGWRLSQWRWRSVRLDSRFSNCAANPLWEEGVLEVVAEVHEQAAIGTLECVEVHMDRQAQHDALPLFFDWVAAESAGMGWEVKSPFDLAGKGVAKLERSLRATCKEAASLMRSQPILVARVDSLVQLAIRMSGDEDVKMSLKINNMHDRYTGRLYCRTSERIVTQDADWRKKAVARLPIMARVIGGDGVVFEVEVNLKAVQLMEGEEGWEGVREKIEAYARVLKVEEHPISSIRTGRQGVRVTLREKVRTWAHSKLILYGIAEDSLLPVLACAH